MSNRPQPFKQHHVERALRAATAAGLSNPSVRVRLPGGAELHVGSGDFAEGGTAHMLPKQTAGPAKAGVTGHVTKGDRPGLARGGAKTDRSPSLALPAKPGKTSPLKQGR